MIFSDYKMNKNDHEVDLLIHAILQPENITILLNRKKSTISDRRSSLAMNIFDTSKKFYNSTM